MDESGTMTNLDDMASNGQQQQQGDEHDEDSSDIKVHFTNCKLTIIIIEFEHL